MSRNLLFELEVEMDRGPGGAVAGAVGDMYKIVADQRDIARWEVQPFGCGFANYADRAMLFVRFIAWSASVRQQKTTLEWEPWSDQCLEVTSLDDLPGAKESTLSADAGDPGRMAQ